MSTPPQNDGGTTGGEEFYRNALNPNLAQQLPHLQQYVSGVGLPPQAAQTQVPGRQPPPPPPPQFLHWANPLMGGSTFLQHAPPQQLFNDVLFNLQAQAAFAASVPSTPVAPAVTQQETYSVLRVGNRNFLKIYHCPENAMGPMPGETSFATMHHPFIGQPPPPANAYHHINQTPQQTQQQQAPSQQLPQDQPLQLPNSNSGPPQVFNSYELFSSNTFTQLPTAEMPPILVLGPNSNANCNINSTEPATVLEELMSEEEMSQELPQLKTETTNAAPSANLGSNWLGNNAPIPVYGQYEICPTQKQTDSDFVPTGHSQDKAENKNDNPDIYATEANVVQTPSKSNSFKQSHKDIASLKTSNNSFATTGGLSHHKSEIPRQEAPKKRIVAEVKPMRMTYSDVLSKINNQTQNSSSYAMQQSTLSSNASNRNQQKTSAKILATDNVSVISLNTRRNTEEFSSLRTSAKKSPTHDNKENQQQFSSKNIKDTAAVAQKRAPAGTATTAIHNLNSNTITAQQKPTASAATTTTTTTSNQKNSINNTKISANESQQQPQLQKKRINNKNTECQINGGGKNFNDARAAGKVNNGNTPNNSAAAGNVYNSANNTYARKTTKTTSAGGTSISSLNSSSGGGQQRSRYQNNSSVSYSYLSTKRNRNSSSYGTSSSINNSSNSNHGSDSNRNYELAKRFLQAWYTYSLKIIIWLFNLVYDIVVVGCSILYERLTSGYEYCRTYAKQFYKDLKQNSNKPGIWFKNTCRRFDARFSKNSRWAIWRRFYKKRPPETAGESVKTGRLPQTGEEAMYQLLNCKGKDAYSILGVPPNSSQEQIRKHYKKIAVLVHPDKNKQPGAEEAFKVLQRAFELVGEPENRLSYDQSLAEALHAEKAWTELHDLLSQLQTKITEAANTIRCSTCGLRHPRKITDRPHYAARECASCKIRHSAREGDIWAETSMLGLRWKYLALMEGKVYDITEWANCQKGALAHLEPNSHMVQYRIVRGAQHQQQQQQQQQQHQQQQKQQTHQQQQQHTGSHYSGSGTGGTFKRDNIPNSEASLHEFLDNLYSGQHPQQQQQNTSAYAGSSRRRNRRN